MNDLPKGEGTKDQLQEVGAIELAYPRIAKGFLQNRLPQRKNRFLGVWGMVGGLVSGWMFLGLALLPTLAGDEAALAERRLAETVQYLTSEELEGRGVGTKGLDLAAEYIAQQFGQAGLKTQLYEGKPFQKFVFSRGAKLGPNNRVRLVGPPAKKGGPPQVLELRVGEDFTPMSLSGSGEFDLPMVFAGYSITAPKENYDDYAGVDVRGKAVVVLRHEPQQADPKSVFAGTQYSEHASFVRKVANAREHGAAAVLICSDRFDLDKTAAQARKTWYETKTQLAQLESEWKQQAHPTEAEVQAHRGQVQTLEKQLAELAPQLQPEYDPLVPFAMGPRPSGDGAIPVVYCRRAVLEPIIHLALGKDLSTIEAEIDKTLQPQSRSLEGWRVVGRVDIQGQTFEIKNVLGVIEGQGPWAQQHVILGAHYDHLGYGGFPSMTPWKKQLHPGADDNASGVAVMLEAARHLASRKQNLKRSVLCIAFTAEEQGLVGSRHYVNQPLWPLEHTIAMINLDMVGRLRENRLTVMGSGTAKQFGPLLDQLNAAHGFELMKVAGGVGPSDQMPFFTHQIPVLHFFTGMHSDYHRPSDTADKLNIAGMQRIARWVAELIETLANTPEVPEYVAVSGGFRLPLGGDRPFLGTVPDFERQETGCAIAGVVPGGPAAKAGLQAGDVIIQFDQDPITSLADLEAALRKHKPGQKVSLLVRRKQEKLSLEVTLAPRP